MEAMYRAVHLRAALVARIQTYPTWRLPHRRTSSTSSNNLSGIQMLPKNIRKHLFPFARAAWPADESVQLIREHLKQFDVWNPTPDQLPDVEMKLPTLLGANIEEHFFNIGTKFTDPYMSALNRLIVANVPAIPLKFAFTEGWVRYTANGNTYEKVDAPEGGAIVFDIETVVSEGGLPAMAVALSDQHWYSWCSSALVNGRDHRVTKVTPDVLIPLGSATDHEQVVVGHSVAFDRSFVREEYDGKLSRRRFVDTLSMHICVSGQATSQRTMSFLRKKWALKEENPTTKLASIEDVFKWGKVSTLNSLADVYQLYCQKELSKLARRVFEEGTSDDVRADFHNLMKYCFIDVKATRDVLKQLLPQFMEHCPHPVSLFGTMEILRAYLPVTEDWGRYLSRAEAAYTDTNTEIQYGLNMLVKRACRMHEDDLWRKDPWLCQLNWTIQDVKRSKRRSSDASNTAEPTSGSFLGQPDMRQFPHWYRELCKKPLEDEFESTSEPLLWEISTRKRCLPKLLKLTWAGYPLYFHNDYGWGYLVPDDKDRSVMFEWGQSDEYIELFEDTCGRKSKHENIVAIQPASEFPVEEYMRIVDETRRREPKPENLVAIQPDEEILDLDDLSNKDSYKDWQAMRKVFAKQFESTQDLEEDSDSFKVRNVVDAITREEGIDIGIPGIVFRRLPHKFGVMYTVGNPLSKDFLDKHYGHLLGSWDTEDVDRLLELMKQVTSWTGLREKLKQQMVVWTGEGGGVILPWVSPAGTISRRPTNIPWLSGDTHKTYRIGSEYRAMVRAPKGMDFVRARFKSIELWIASILGDKAFHGVHGGTAFSWMTLKGTRFDGSDVHSKSAAILGCSSDYAKIIDMARIYGAELAFLVSLLRKVDPTLTKDEATARCEKLIRTTKGVRIAPSQSNSFYDFDWRNASKGPQLWFDGSESYTHNALIKLAAQQIPHTPFLHAQITRALQSAVVGSTYMKARQTWILQSSAIDYLHLMLASMTDLLERFGIDGRLVLANHDEVAYMVPSEKRFQAALALHISNLFARAMLVSRLGLEDLPLRVAFLDGVSIDKTLRGDVMNDMVTPSNKLGLEKNYGIPKGEVVDIYEAIKRA